MDPARVAREKARLRAALGARRRSVPREEAGRAGEAVAARVAELPAWAGAARVALYAALPDELPSRPLFERVRASGRTALLPRIEGRRLVFAPLARWEDLRPGRYGVLQPPREAEPAEPDTLVVVPGVAFDRGGHRLGRGGGYYDRAFGGPGPPGRWLVGVGYAFQLLAAVPHDAGDRRVDAVVTEAGTWCAGEGT